MKIRLLVVCALVIGGLRTVGAQEPAPGPGGDSQAPLTDLALEDLLKLKVDTVYAASKFQQEVTQAPASVSIVTADEILAHGYRTLAEILQSVRGFYVSYDRNYSYVGVRGFQRPGDYNSRILLLVNGHQLNDTIYEEALVGTEFPVDVALFDRVEVIRGPSSSLYGTSAFFAVVNVITRSGRALNGIEVEAQGGSQTLRAGRFTAGRRTTNGMEGMFSVSGLDTSGNRELYFPAFDAPETNNGIARDADGDRSLNLFGSAAARGFQVQMSYGVRRKTVPTASFGTLFNDTRTETRDARGFADVQYNRAVSARSTLRLRASYDHQAYDGTYAYDSGLFKDGARGSWLTTEVSLVHRFNQHSLTAGFEYRKNLKQDQSAIDGTGVVLLDDHRDSRTAALYLEDEVRVSRLVLVNAGLRWDKYYDTFGGTLNPRLGVIVMPFEGSALKLLYGRAFRAPNPFELYYEQDAVSAALQPERISTYELVWEQQVNPRLQVSGSIFHNRVRDLITQKSGSTTSIDGLFYENGGGVSATGLELELQAVLPGRIRARVSHTFESATDAQTGTGISNAPEHLATLDFDVPIARSGFSAGFNTSFVGERRTVRDARVPRAVVSDLTISAPRLWPRLGLAVSAHNVFDAAYGDPGSEEHLQEIIPQDGRTVAVRATWRLR